MTTNLGRDTYCADELQPGRLAEGVMLVALNQYHRLKTPRGMLRGPGPEAQNYGLPLDELVGQADTEAKRAAMPGQIRAELLKDPRVESVDVKMTVTTAGGLVEYAFAISGQTGEGPYELVVKASAVTVQLLGIAA
jgi:hypothetical protein